MSRNLQLRIIFGLLYAGFIVGMLLWGKTGAIILLGLFGLLMIWEYNNISLDDKSISQKLILTLLNIPIVLVIYFLLQSKEDLYPLLVISVVYSIANIYLLFTRKRTLVVSTPHWFHMLMYLSLPLLIGILAVSFVDMFSMLLLYLFLIVWLCDVGAYFIGKGFGKRKLFPIISPNKTWAGFYGGILAGILTSVAIYYYSNLFNLQQWIFIGIAVCITSILGDLVESSFKRHHQIKDSSNIIPGHGGFLDRLDSFIFALPFYTLIILIFAK